MLEEPASRRAPPAKDGQSTPTLSVGASESRVIEDRQELEMFKRDVDLSAYAAARGYRLDPKESSPRTRVMRAEGDKINISRMPSGLWVYYSFRDPQDNGTIIDFVAKRDHHAEKGSYPVGRIRQELRRWTHTERPLPEFAQTPLLPTTKDLALVDQVLARAQTQRSHPYLELERALPATTLSDPRFLGKWSTSTGYFRDGRWVEITGGRGNVLFPHRNEAGVCGYEAKNRDFTGFAQGGEKGLWTSRARATDNVLVFAESAIDAMSHHALHPNPKARYASFAGQLSPAQPVLIERAISRMPPGSTIVAATDNDKDGHDYARVIREICQRHPTVQFARHLPEPSRGKDWNDQLRERSRALAGKGLER